MNTEQCAARENKGDQDKKNCKYPTSHFNEFQVLSQTLKYVKYK